MTVKWLNLYYYSGLW